MALSRHISDRTALLKASARSLEPSQPGRPPAYFIANITKRCTGALPWRATV